MGLWTWKGTNVHKCSRFGLSTTHSLCFNKRCYRKIKNAGGNDLVTVPFVATEWKPVPNHIPFTFPIRYPKRHFPGVSHCHSYASWYVFT